MNAEIKKKWIEALRSGDYRQGFGGLKKEDCFCCLGVLCQIKDPEGWIGPRWHGAMNILPVEEAYKIDLKWASQLTLIDKNDAAVSFIEIANWIEEYL